MNPCLWLLPLLLQRPCKTISCHHSTNLQAPHYSAAQHSTTTTLNNQHSIRCRPQTLCLCNLPQPCLPLRLICSRIHDINKCHWAPLLAYLMRFIKQAHLMRLTKQAHFLNLIKRVHLMRLTKQAHFLKLIKQAHLMRLTKQAHFLFLWDHLLLHTRTRHPSPHPCHPRC